MLFLCIVAGWLFYIMGLRINSTLSYPRGLYQTIQQTHYQKGDLVLACMTLEQRVRGGHYVDFGYSCDNHIPLLKRVVAVEGDQVLVNQYVYINGQKVPNSQLYKNDSKGRLLVAAKSGVVGEGEVWLMSDYYSKSFDSRYIGAFKKEHIIEGVKPFWVIKE